MSLKYSMSGIVALEGAINEVAKCLHLSDELNLRVRVVKGVVQILMLACKETTGERVV